MQPERTPDETLVQTIRRFTVRDLTDASVRREMTLVVNRDNATVYDHMGAMLAQIALPVASSSPRSPEVRPTEVRTYEPPAERQNGSHPVFRLPVIEAALLPSGDLYFDQTPEAVRTTARAHRGLVLLLPVLEDYRQNHPMLHRVR